MDKKHWIVAELCAQSEKESDARLAKRMKEVASRLGSCGSRTIWDVANRGYVSRCKTAVREGKDWRDIKIPDVEESVEWLGEVGGKDAALSTLGLARCKRVQCPICCYSRSFLRRNLALEWAKEREWSDYFVVALTFTVPHRLFDSETPQRFKKVFDNLSKSLSNFSGWICRSVAGKGKSYRSHSPDSVGFISSLEFTFGKNGLHPHFHSLFFTKSFEDVEALRKWFRRDRVRVWKNGHGKNHRMPDINEDLSFKILVRPLENCNLERVLSYINKGLFETLSMVTKDLSKSGSKTIFHLSGSELKYFCTFFEATKGKRFYRAGGICKEIRAIKDRFLDESESSIEVKKHLNRLVKISQKDSNLPFGLVSDFVKKSQSNLEKRASTMSAVDIKSMVNDEWNLYLDDCFRSFKNSISITVG